MGSRIVDIDPDAGTVSGTRNIREYGGSTAIVLPPEILQATKNEAGDEVEVIGDMNSGKICLRQIEGGESESDAGDDS